MNFNKIELSILNKTEKEILKVLSENIIENIHIDIMDGYFVNNLSNISPFFLKNLDLANYKLHLHFMVNDVSKYFEYYNFLDNIELLSFHIESEFFKSSRITPFLNMLKKKNIKV
jgi:pentose-5-phosphate-3-epimerase